MRRDKLEVFWAGFIYIYNNVFPTSPQAGFPNVYISSSNNLSRPIVQYDWDLNVYVSA